MKHNVNYALMGLLLAVIICMVALVIYYNWTYQGLSSQYTDAISSLENVSYEINRTRDALDAKEAQLNEKERKLLEYISELNISKQREESLGSHFDSLEGQVTSLETNLNSTLVERNRYANLYDKYYTESLQWKDNSSRERQLREEAEDKLTDARSYLAEIDILRSDIYDQIGNITEKVKDAKESSSTISSKSDNPGEDVTEENINSINSLSEDVYDDLNSIISKLNDVKNSLSQISTYTQGTT